MHLMYLISGLLGLLCTANSTIIKVQDRPAVPHNATLHRRNDFNKYGGCTKPYNHHSGKFRIDKAKDDMLRMAEHVIYKSDTDWNNPGVLEERFFGGLLKNNDYMRPTIQRTITNIANWYPWIFFDRFWGKRIEVYCEVDQPNPQGTSCIKYPRAGGYALSIDGKAKIVFCKRFFDMESDLRSVDLFLYEHREHSKDLTWMDTAARIFFHEMTHLAIIDGTQDPIVHDRGVSEGGILKPAYGPKLAELLAVKAPGYAYVNADNYAWYATAKWFSAEWGIPDSSLNSAVVDDFEDYFVYDNSTYVPTNDDDGLPDWDEISADEAIAFAAGDYTPNGWLQGRNLRILPLGDSITNGFQSTDGNGYREDLLSILVQATNKVQMVGSLRAGTMTENQNEGHNGATIAQIATFTGAYAQRPNVVLLHAGTNDLHQPSDPSTAPQRLDDLVGQLLTAMPDTVILVARIIQSKDAATSALIPQFNNAITDLIAKRAQSGQHVLMVDMPSGVTTADLFDDLHPNNEGYNKMAIKWAIGLTAANSLGWIKDPVPGVGGELVPCTHDPTWIAQGEIASGAGLGADLWLTVECISNPISGLCDCQPPRTPEPLTQKLLDSTNTCDIKTVSSPLTSAVHFADLNSDGRAEYLYVGDNGDVTAFLNLGGPDNGPNAAKVSWLPSGVIATGMGTSRAAVHFADINGDGRAEYLVVNDNGSVDAWLNLGGPDNGPNAAKVSWLAQGTIATGIGKDGAGVRFADLNGDGRAEYLYVNADGSVEAYLNLGGPDEKLNAAKVGWLPQGTIATGVGLGRENVVFADINGDGRADYVAVDRVVGSAQLWLNGGGPDNGPNAAKVVWYPHGTIATGVGGYAKGLQFADLNGDGRAEYLDVAFDTSAVRAWLNGC